MGRERDRHWQEVWKRAGLATARRVSGHRKFFALNAYPGASGFFHVGHLRAYAYVDALHRYHRMLGEEVLLPFGVHASGIPAVQFAQKVKDRTAAVVAQLEAEHVPPEQWGALETPEGAVRFLGESYQRVLASIGVLYDSTSYLTTIDDDYQAFIRWQFRTLRAEGALVQGTHYAPVCPVCGPVAVDPAETDLARGGDAEIVKFVTVPFPLDDGRILLAATLRPETVFGVTNLWVPAGGELRVWHHREQLFLVAAAGAERLVEQHGGTIGHTVAVGEVVGREVTVPLRGHRVPVLEGGFVEAAIGTGVVMSVPAHAPADAAALRELPAAWKERIGTPPVLLDVPSGAALAASESELVAGTGTPAEKALRAAGAETGRDRAKIESATERLYRLEYVRGRMTIPELSGVLVREAREHVARQLDGAGASFVLREFSKPVVCRNGHAVTIRRVPDQWFLHYGDPAWKERTQTAAASVRAWPAEYGRELPEILDWFEDRPCTRRGRWLGTPFPLDPTWTIEPIADSTLYMAYFVVRRFVFAGRLSVSQLTDAFFDFIFLGAGAGEPTVDRSLLDEIRAEFLYWYPLDLNMGGSEHKRVHFPVFLYTHAKLLPTPLQPRGIFVNGWITGPSGDKVSKKDVASKGGRIPTVEGALEEWGADPLRLYYVTAASPAQDVEWDSDAVAVAAERLGEVARMVTAAGGDGDGPPELDAWLLSVVRQVVEDVRAAYDATDLRAAAEATYARLPNTLKRYYARGGAAGGATDRVASAWIRLLGPITPHLAEELAGARFTGPVARERFPDPEAFPRSTDAEAREAFLARVEDDIRAVLRPAAGRDAPAPEAVTFFLAAPWKATIELWAREEIDLGHEPTVAGIMERVVAHPELAGARSEIPRYLSRVVPLLRSEPAPGIPVDEAATLRSAEGYLARRLGFRTVAIYAEAEAAPHDPLGRRQRARPGRPAFYLARAPPA